MLTLWRRRLKNKRRRVSLDAALRGKMFVEVQRLARLEKKIIDKNQNAFMKLKRMMKSMCYAPIHGTHLPARSKVNILTSIEVSYMVETVLNSRFQK